MTRPPSLNTPARTYGAAMVSGTLWTAHTFASGALSFTKYSSGPVILWAKPGEKENVPDALTPMRSALEERAAEANTAAAFERLYWAARGRVRPSVRWKTGTKKKRLCAYYALLYIKQVAFDISHEEAASKGLTFWQADETPKGRRETRRVIKREKFLAQLRGIASADMNMDNPYGIEGSLINFWEMRTASIANLNVDLSKWIDALPKGGKVTGQLFYFVLKKDWKGFRISFSGLIKPCLALAALLKHLEAAAYRAHLARRVKPVQRRDRAPRPLYARPRPPTAPTAPPLREASA